MWLVPAETLDLAPAPPEAGVIGPGGLLPGVIGALPEAFAALLEEGGGREGRRNRLDRRCGTRGAGVRVHEELPQCALTPEQKQPRAAGVPWPSGHNTVRIHSRCMCALITVGPG